MLKWDKRYISSRFAGRFGRIRSLDYGKGFSKWAAGHIMVILKSSRWSVRQERSSSQAKANLNDALKRDSKHIFVDVTWGLAPIDFIYCIGKKNIHLLNKGYFRGHLTAPWWEYIIPLNQPRNPEALGLWTGLSKPADYLWAKALRQATWLFTSQGLLALHSDFYEKGMLLEKPGQKRLL